MSRPIEVTPPVEGDDAIRLLEALAVMCSTKEWERRGKASRRRIAKLASGQPALVVGKIGENT